MMSPDRALIRALLLAAPFALSGCAKTEEAPAVPAHDPNLPLMVADQGLSTPESVLWDQAREVWYVSNINGSPLAKDDNGFIVRLGTDGKAADTLPFINGSDADITLHSPKGMALVGDTLWVSDIDVVRAFDVTTGRTVRTVELAKLGAVFLNDVAAGKDGAIYITDTGISFGSDGSVNHIASSRVFEVRGDAAKEAVVLPKGSGANGIDCSMADGSCLIIGFAGTEVYAWTPGAKTTTVAGSWIGGGDGVVILEDGRALFSSWTDSSLVTFVNGTSVTLRKGLPTPADLGYDPMRDIVAVPLFTLNRVEFWSVQTR